MNKIGIKKNWFVLFVIFLFLLQLLVMTAWGEHSFVAIHDNLDLFVAHNTMMKKAGIFFSQDTNAPMLAGVSRDVLGSEFSLYNLLYVFLPSYGAYAAAYLLKMRSALAAAFFWPKRFTERLMRNTGDWYGWWQQALP